MSNLLDSETSKSIGDVVREFFQVDSTNSRQIDAIASSSSSSCCVENPRACNISKAERKVETGKNDSGWATSVPYTWGGSSCQELAASTSRDSGLGFSSLGSLLGDSPLSRASVDPAVQNCVENVQKFLQMSSCNEVFNHNFGSNGQDRNTSSYQSPRLWHLNDSSSHSEEQHYSRSPQYCPFGDMDERFSSFHGAQNRWNSSETNALSRADRLLQKNFACKRKLSGSDTDVDILETPIKEPEVITLNDSGDENKDESPAEEGEIISCVTSPIPELKDSSVIATVKEQITLKEKLSQMESFTETRRLTRDPTLTSTIHMLDQRDKEKTKHQEQKDLERDSRPTKRKNRDIESVRQRKKSKKEIALPNSTRKPRPGTLAELLQENHPERFSERVAKKTASDCVIGVSKEGTDHCSHSGSDVEEEELMLRKLALESVVVSLENENQSRAKVVLSPVGEVACQDNLIDNDLNPVAFKDCETPVDMEISNSDAEMENKPESWDSCRTFTFPIEWAYMIPPPAAAHQQNDLNSFKSFSYEQNLCKQAMESSLENNLGVIYGSSCHADRSIAPQSFHSGPATSYSCESSIQYPKQCPSSIIPLALNVLQPCQAEDGASGSNVPSTYGCPLSQANAHNQEAFMNAVAKQTKSNEANLIHIKLNKAPTSKKVRKRGKKSNKLNNDNLIHNKVAIKEAPVSGDHLQSTVQSEDEEQSLRNELLLSLFAKAQNTGSANSAHARPNNGLLLQSNRIITGSPVNSSETTDNTNPVREDVPAKSSAAEAVPVKHSFRYPKPIIINLDDDSDSDDSELHLTSATASSGISSPGNTDDLVKSLKERHLEGSSTDGSGAILAMESSCSTVIKHLSRSSQAEYRSMQLRLQQIYQDRKQRRDRQAKLKRLIADKDQVSTASDTSNDCSQPEQSCFADAAEEKSIPMQPNDEEMSKLSSEKETISVARANSFDEANVFGRLGDLHQQTPVGPQFDELFKDTDIDERVFLPSFQQNAASASAIEPESEEDLRNLLLSRRVSSTRGQNDLANRERLDQCSDLREVLSNSSLRKSDLMNDIEKTTDVDSNAFQNISEQIDCYLKSIRRSSTLKIDESCIKERSKSSSSSSLSSGSDSSSEDSSSTDSELMNSDSDIEGNKENSPVDQNAEIAQSKHLQVSGDFTLQSNVQLNDDNDKYSSRSECISSRPKMSTHTTDNELHEFNSVNRGVVLDQDHSVPDIDMETDNCSTETNPRKAEPVCGLETSAAAVPGLTIGPYDRSSPARSPNIGWPVQEAASQTGGGGTSLQASVANVDPLHSFEGICIQSKQEEVLENKTPNANVQTSAGNLDQNIGASKLNPTESNNVCTPVLESDENLKKSENDSFETIVVNEVTLPLIGGAGACEEATKLEENLVPPLKESNACDTDVYATVSSSCELILSNPAEHATVDEKIGHIATTTNSEHKPRESSYGDHAVPGAEFKVHRPSSKDPSNFPSSGSPASVTLTPENLSSECEEQSADEKLRKSWDLSDKPMMATGSSGERARGDVPVEKLSVTGPAASSEGASSKKPWSGSGVGGSGSKVKQAKLLMLKKYEHLIQERKGKLQSLQADVQRQAAAVRTADSELLQMRNDMDKLEKALAGLRAQYKKKSGEHYRSSQRLVKLQGQAAADSLTLTKMHAAAQKLGEQAVGDNYSLEHQSFDLALGSSGKSEGRSTSVKRPPVDKLNSLAKRHKTWTRSSGCTTKWSNNFTVMSKTLTSASGNSVPSGNAVVKNKSLTIDNARPVIRKASNFRLDNRPLARSTRTNATLNLSSSPCSPSKFPSLSDSTPSPKRNVNPLSESELRNRLLQKLQQNSPKQISNKPRTSDTSDPFCPFGLLGTCNDENCTYRHLSSDKDNGGAKSSDTSHSSPVRHVDHATSEVLLGLNTSDCCDSDASSRVSIGQLKSTASEELSVDVNNGKLEIEKSVVSKAENVPKTGEESLVAQKIVSTTSGDEESDDSSSDSDDSDSSSSDSESDSDSSSDSSDVDAPKKPASIVSSIQPKDVSDNLSIMNETQETTGNVGAPDAGEGKEPSHQNQVCDDVSGGGSDWDEECALGASVSGSVSQCVTEADCTATYKSSRDVNVCYSSDLIQDASKADVANDDENPSVIGSIALQQDENHNSDVVTAGESLQDLEGKPGEIAVVHGIVQDTTCVIGKSMEYNKEKVEYNEKKEGDSNDSKECCKESSEFNEDRKECSESEVRLSCSEESMEDCREEYTEEGAEKCSEGSEECSPANEVRCSEESMEECCGESKECSDENTEESSVES